MGRTQNNASSKVILYTVDNFHYGGVTTFVKQYCSMAHSLGYTTVILGFSGDMENPAGFFRNSQVIQIAQNMQKGAFGRLLSSIPYIQMLRRVYAQSDIHVIHFSTTWSSLFALMVPHTWRIRRVCSFYGLYFKEYLSQNQPGEWVIVTGLKSALMKILQRGVLSVSDTIIVFSDYAMGLLKTFHGHSISSKTVRIPGCIRSIPKYKKRLPTPHTLTLINIGRAEPRKGIETMLRAVYLLIQSDIPCRTIIASPVWYLKNYGVLDVYEHLNLGLTVQFTHTVSGKIKERLYAMADAFVLPSQDLETFGLTTIESLSRGIPVIGTPTGATPEILSRVDKRLICSDGTAESIYKKISWFAGLSVNSRKTIAKKARTAVSQNYLERLYLRSLQHVYES